MSPERPWHRRGQRLDPEDLHQLLATEEYLDEWEYLSDDNPREPFEPGDYLDDRGSRR
jgi:hypothetical protein